MKKIAAYKFTIISAALILVALLLPSSSFSSMPRFFGVDKIAHFCLFLLFTLSYTLEFRRLNGKLPGFFHSIVFVLIFIVSSELLQLLTSSRHFEFLDMAFDAGGAAAAFLVTRLGIGADR
ncbi:MAG TPA: VanZ family protein [Rectinemataceae bacterium]|nr:VanZ family protein [Rectinemataceae bacterium]